MEIVNKSPKDVGPEILQKDPREEVSSKWQGAVLLSDEITFYATQKGHPLIHPFEPTNLKPA